MGRHTVTAAAPSGADLRLVPIERSGSPLGLDLALAGVAEEACRSTAALYAAAGYAEPWLGYLALEGGTIVGTCAFKGPPAGGSVEIAYFTFPGHEGRGVATAMARALLEIARRADRQVRITAQTLPQENASTAVLRKLGFTLCGSLRHPEDGEVWQWQLETGAHAGKGAP